MGLWDGLEGSSWRGNDLTILFSQKIKNKQEMTPNKLSFIIELYAREDMEIPVHLLPRIHKVSSFSHHLSFPYVPIFHGIKSKSGKQKLTETIESMTQNTLSIILFSQVLPFLLQLQKTDLHNGDIILRNNFY